MATSQSPNIAPAEITLSVPELVEMVGRSRAWLFAVLKAQGVTSVDRGRYRLADVMGAITGHFETLARQQRDRLAANSRMNDLRAAEIEQRIEAKMSGLIPMSDVVAEMNIFRDIVLQHMDLMEPDLVAAAVAGGSTADVPALLDQARGRILAAFGHALELARTGVDPTDPDAAPRRAHK